MNRDGEPMRADKFHFEILPKRLHLHVPNADLLVKGQGQASHSRHQPSSPRTQNQQSFAKKVVHATDRPERKNEGKAKAKSIAKTTAKYGLAFTAGGLAGAFATKRGLLTKLRFF